MKFNLQKLDPLSALFSDKAFVRFLFVELVILGSWVEVAYGWEGALSRMGAATTIVALWILRVQLRNLLSLQRWEGLYSVLSQSRIERYGGREVLIDERSGTMMSSPTLVDDFRDAKFGTISQNISLYRSSVSRLTDAQIELAILGTFLWGFADLVPWI